MKNWSAKDWFIFVVGSGFIGWGILMIIGTIVSGRPMSDKAGEIFVSIVVGLSSALGLYFGKVNGRQ